MRLSAKMKAKRSGCVSCSLDANGTMTLRHATLNLTDEFRMNSQKIETGCEVIKVDDIAPRLSFAIVLLMN